ncbi:MAG: histone deacetylase [Candidatus Nanoarchaeia archaeon]|nr:histone deacetylase [Candidatus Haiyanarchaeum thermophilum]MCW1303183.1 histone deacetylase [Candidatus Haiyanarchaeum thermophilum]MCW1303849.1 histone deacetylase [Candidatus Haiyanarchaeum thermophilum]MCW1306535.1 histone deacetylase [Candidatus Haiyanarchaeum thermophilum]MCW1306948.1 histone deacetylase [Candidatus Haiyanarchaeum thermophilum]
MKLIFSPRCLEYGFPSHPENPERLRQAYEFLKPYYSFIEPREAEESELLLVHSKEYVEIIRREEFYDPDTPAYPNIYKYALLSAGAAIIAAKQNCFSLMRPPGHHAGRNGLALGAPTLGFCYFNNIAIATRKLGKKVLILDIDAHHGNGTQEIFQGDPNVIYISLHTKGIYPGTGLKSEGNCYNFPLPWGTGDEEYLSTLEKALKGIDLSGVEIVGVSAGFDTLRGDLGGLSLSEGCFRKIGKIIRELNLPTFFILEGGYRNLGKCIFEFLRGFEGET